MTDPTETNPLVFGHDRQPGLVAVEHVPGGKRGAASDQMMLFVRDGDTTREQREPFFPFAWVEKALPLEACPGIRDVRELAGANPLNRLVHFESWASFGAAKSTLAKTAACSPGAPEAPFLFLNDPVQQYLMTTGRTLFKGMAFGQLKRMQLDIETFTEQGYEFSNPEREADRIIAIALADQTGWTEVLSGAELDEKTLLETFVARVKERDPDVLEGHNLFNFDLPYIAARAKRHKVKLALGRNGKAPRARPSRFSAGERTIGYTRFDVFGRHVVDTLFMVQAYDITHRSLEGFGLKEVAVHFGLAPKDRTYLAGSEIAATFLKEPDTVLRYAHDDIVETRALSNLLSQSYFTQARILPYAYQNICVRGNATKIDALLLREYLRQAQGVAIPERVERFAGGYTDMFFEGVARNVHHCDVRSLYPSLMLKRGKDPKKDDLHVFLKLLDYLRTFRFEAKAKMKAASDESERTYLDALQGTFKILINSFYGYLGFSQARFNDFKFAAQITGEGRDLLKAMIEWLREHGAQPIEIDTDGVYFVPPPTKHRKELEAFRKAFTEWLPEGIEIEFDGEYAAMFSYKMKNYALLEENGEIIVKGAALKSRGLEPFQRRFLEQFLRLRLEGKNEELPALKKRYEQDILQQRLPVRMLAKTETLQAEPATYQAKRAGGKRARSAAYELALASTREYRAGDQISYYVTGHKKSVAAHANAKLVSEWDPAARDENVPYYLAKLAGLFKKFCPDG